MPRSLLALACVAAFTLACSGSNRSGDGPRTIANHEVWTPVGAAPTSPVVATDGARGVITAWLELPLVTHPTEIDLRAHRPGRWPAGGVLVGTMRGEPAITASPLPAVQIVPDGEGGAILAWSEYLTTIAATVSAQRIDADGTVRWAAGGVPVCAGGGAGPSSWRDFSLASDGAGGAVVAWMTETDAGSYVAAQRLAASDGAPLWGDCGLRASPIEPPGRIYTLKLVPDGAGGVIVTWWRVVGGAIAAQRLDSSGAALWGDSHVLLVTSGSEYDAVSDGAGGAIVAGNVMASAGNFGILAQRVDSSGSLLWEPVAGVTVTAPGGFLEFPRLAADGSGGAVVAWIDHRGSVYDAGSWYAPAIYAQRVTGEGSVAWTADGVLVCGKRVPYLIPVMQVVSDGSGGAILAWADDRDGVGHVLAQRLAGADGAAAWVADGMYLADAPGGQGAPVAVSDGSGGAIVVFVDWRTGTGGLYSQRVAFDGTLP
jgi:hypothetical protein